MNTKLVFIYIFAVATISMSTAQTLFHDDWEAYRPGTQDWEFVGNYHYGDFDIDLDAGEQYPTVVEGPKDGVAPYSGKQMYDFRGSAIKGGRYLRHSLSSKSTDNPIVDVSIRFNVPSTYVLKTSLLFGVNTSLFNGAQSAGGSANFDLANNTMKGFAIQPKPLLVPRDAWNEFRMRVDWKAKKTSIFLNWQLVDSKSFVTGQTQPPYGIEQLYFGVTAQENYSNQYPVETGIPGMFVDDVRFQAVPEPLSWCYLAAGMCALHSWRRKRGA